MVDGDVENLSTNKLAEAKNPNLAKFENLDLAVIHFFRTELLIPEAKKTFLYL